MSWFYDEPRFKAGDRVRYDVGERRGRAGTVLAPIAEDDPHWHGQTWMDYDGDYFRLFRIRWDDGHTTDCDELELEPLT